MRLARGTSAVLGVWCAAAIGHAPFAFAQPAPEPPPSNTSAPSDTPPAPSGSAAPGGAPPTSPVPSGTSAPNDTPPAPSGSATPPGNAPPAPTTPPKKTKPPAKASAARPDDAAAKDTAGEKADGERPAWETEPAEHRGGFAIGVVAGGGFGAANGYPNDSAKIGTASAYTESGIGVAFASNLWIGGALADWLTFGFGAGFSTIATGDTKSEAANVFFHTDVYPLYPVGGLWRDLGVSFDFGTGAATATDDDGQKVIDGAGPSFLQTTVFLEAIPFWKVRLGPFIGEHYTFSSSIRRPALLGGLRMSLYTSP